MALRRPHPAATRLLAVACLVLLPVAGARAEVLNYDYVYLSREGAASGASGDGGNGAAGGFRSFGAHTHVFASLDDTAFYAGSNADWDYDLTTLRVGVGGHYPLGPRTMLAPSIAVFRSQGEVMVPAWAARRDLEATGAILELDIRHAVTRWLELVGGVRRTRFDGQAWNETAAGVMVHPTDRWAFGAIHHDRAGERSTELTVRYYY
jgi:hypothetical protein